MGENLAKVVPIDLSVVNAYDMASTIFNNNNVIDAGGVPLSSDGYDLGLTRLSDAQIDARMDECFGFSPKIQNAVERARLDISNGNI